MINNILRTNITVKDKGQKNSPPEVEDTNKRQYPDDQRMKHKIQRGKCTYKPSSPS